MKLKSIYIFFYISTIILQFSNMTISGIYLNKNNKPNIKNIQRILQLTGYYNYAIDGDWGNGSKKALARFLKCFNSFNNFNNFNIKTNGSINSKAIDFLENKFNFYEYQKKYYSRVKKSIRQKEQKIKILIQGAKLKFPIKNIFIRIFKNERLLEVWGLNHNQKYKKIVEYKFSGYSGKLGPKRKLGDRQIPEGIYFLEHFNPNSNFYLSLKVSYPNKSDKILSKYKNLGGDIFIHGSFVTIGCIPITNDKIKELYLLALSAVSNRQLYIPIHIFPFRMSDSNLKKMYKHRKKSVIELWNSLKPIYDFFTKNKMLPDIKINNNGFYNIVKD